MTPLAGRVALVTGAGRGIGRSLARQLAQAGAKLALNDIDDAPLQEAVAEIAGAGGTATGLAGSVTEAGFPDRFVQAALDGFGRIDIVVNNAGYVWNGRFETMTDAQWQAMLDVHLTAPFRLIRRVVQHWKQAGRPAEGPRRIVSVSSISGTHGAAGQAAYAAAKSGLIGLTRSLARELGPDGVTVNTVAFGYIQTRLTQEVRGETAIEVDGRSFRVGLTAAALDELRRRVPLRRAGSTEEAAGGVLLLCLPQADYITGQIIEIDGGLAI